MIQNKLILTDADGVLIDWCFGFDYFLKSRHGIEVQDTSTYSLAGRYGIPDSEAKALANEFNVSKDFEKIPPVRDAIKYVRKLHEEKGYIFHVITSACPSSSAYQKVYGMRKKNLQNLFGKTAIFKLSIINFRTSKEPLLEKYKDSGCVWVEDHIENYDMGEKLGLNAILMKQSYTKGEYDGRQCVSSWKEIYDMLK